MKSLLKGKELPGPYNDMLGTVSSFAVTSRRFGPVWRKYNKWGVMLRDGDHTAFQHAASQWWPLICSELIDRGADVTAADTVIMSILISMLCVHDPSMCSGLMTCKAGNTPLHLVASATDKGWPTARDTVHLLLGFQGKTSG